MKSYDEKAWPDPPARAIWNEWKHSQDLLNAMPDVEEVNLPILVEQIRISRRSQYTLAAFDFIM